MGKWEKLMNKQNKQVKKILKSAKNKWEKTGRAEWITGKTNKYNFENIFFK